MNRYYAVPASPAEQQDPELNPDFGPLGWVVMDANSETMLAFGDGYMDRRVATARAAMLNDGKPGTYVINDSE
jgi:hypothetical protein